MDRRHRTRIHLRISLTPNQFYRLHHKTPDHTHLKRQQLCGSEPSSPSEPNLPNDSRAGSQKENKKQSLNNSQPQSDAPTERPVSRVLQSKENDFNVQSAQNTCKRPSIGNIDANDSLNEIMESNGKENCTLPENDVESGTETRNIT